MRSLKAVWIWENISSACWPPTNEGALGTLECVKGPVRVLLLYEAIRLKASALR